MLNSERIMAVLSLKVNHFIPVCDLVKIGAIEQTLKWGTRALFKLSFSS